MSYTAELIAVGTELLLGNIANTDAQMLSRGLSELGINVFYHTVVGDNPQRLQAAVDLAKTRADIIITTGGLGPTCDDLTKNVLAQCFGRKLVYDETSAKRIERYFQQLHTKRPMTANNYQQAMLPEGCTIFSNDWGTAPGCAFEAEGVHVIMLPGPPRECAAMFQHRAVPYLKRFSDGEICSRTLRVFGLGESSVEDQLRDRMNTLTNPTLAPYAKEGEVELRITAKAHTHAEAQALIAPVEAEVRDLLGDAVYGADVDSGTPAGETVHPGLCRVMYRRSHRQAVYRPARRFRRLPGRDRQLYQYRQGGPVKSPPGPAGGVWRGLRPGGRGHGPGRPAGSGV